jgi:cell wall-associated NlpC family hydrolase
MPQEVTLKRTLGLTLATLGALAIGTIATATANAAQVSISAPSGLSAGNITANSFQVKWNPESGPGYHVQVLVNSTQQVQSLVTSHDYANISNLKAGQKYEVRVQVNTAGAPYAQVTVTTQESFNQEAAAYVKTLEGIPYVYGGTTPQGFDCSGLTQYVYRHYGKDIQRTANDQFLEFRQESQAQAQPGDLVFFHDTSNLASYVYHVGIFEGGEDMVDAPQTGQNVQWQSFTWAGNTVSFGTISH